MLSIGTGEVGLCVSRLGRSSCLDLDGVDNGTGEVGIGTWKGRYRDLIFTRQIFDAQNKLNQTDRVLTIRRDSNDK